MAVVLVTGSKGQLGSEIFALHSKFPQHNFHFVSRNELDISEAAAVREIFQRIKPQYCINCAAFTAVDKAEIEKDTAYAINAVGVKNLAQSANDVGARLIHISTDYVFDGSGTEPYTTDQPINPVNAYGATKAAGEAFCMAYNPSAVIIRTSWVYSEYGNNFVKTMMRLMQTRDSINVVSDQWGSPTNAADLAQAILHIISLKDAAPGIYHYSNIGAITWFVFAKKIAEYVDSACIVKPIPTIEYPTPARRPQYSVMDISKIQHQLNVVVFPWEQSLLQCLQKLK